MQSLVKNAAFGSGDQHIKCVHTSGCTAAFPISEVRKAVSTEAYDKLIERQQADSLRVVSLANYKECPKPVLLTCAAGACSLKASVPLVLAVPQCVWCTLASLCVGLCVYVYMCARACLCACM